MNIQRTLFSITFLLAIVLPAQSFASDNVEHITSFDDQVTVNQDSSLNVVETIAVNVTHDQINHGIYRDFPTRYVTKSGLNVNVHLAVTAVKLDGSDEQYGLESITGGKRIKIGDPNSLVSLGSHTYEIDYTVDRELGYFSDHDELYWNATGNGWLFQIDKATATIILPKDVPSDKITTEFFTGSSGSTAHQGTSSVVGNQVHFTTTNVLLPEEGLTIVVGWPKGYVVPPSAAQTRLWAIEDNLNLILEVLVTLIVLVYFLWHWNKNGRDAQQVTIIPEYEPPQGFTPAMMRYLLTGGTEINQNVYRSLSSTIINLAVKGFLTIKDVENDSVITKALAVFDKRAGKQYELVRTDKAATNLSADETSILENLFTGSDTLILNTGARSRVMATTTALRLKMVDLVGAEYYQNNMLTFWIGVAISIILSWLVAIFSGGAGNILWLIVLYLILLIINTVFYRLLPRYTDLGQQTLAKIKGFKWFLSVTEKDRLNFHNPPEKTPELFEKMLPYAIALGVEQKWADQFTDVFAKLDYRPTWYAGSWAYLNYGAFATDFSHGLTNTLSTVGTPPSSSSGFGGGAGGGGGGGGGGGW